MSKVMSMQSAFTNLDLLRQALEDRGFTPVFEPGYPSIQMDGYAGQKFEANLGIRRRNFIEVTKEGTYGDLGWKLNSDRSLGLIGDDLLLHTPQFAQISNEILQAYGVRNHIETIEQEGFSLVSREVNAAGEIELYFGQRVY